MKRKRKKLVRFLIIILLLASIFTIIILNKDKIYDFTKTKIIKVTNEEKLQQLNYSEDTITLFKENKIDDYIIDKNKYSKTLEMAINNNEFNKEYIDYYLNIDYIEKDNFISLINQLLNINYNDENVNTLFKELNEDSINLIVTNKYDKSLLDFLRIEYFKESKLTDYINYKNKEKNKSIEEVVTYVNIGINNEFYTNINNVDNQDDLLVLVNKYHKLSSSFVPKNLETISSKYSTKTLKLVSVARTYFEQMCAAAEVSGITIKAGSTYRTYSHQQSLYNNYVKQDGKKEADTYSARPGHSEHQTGLAIDIKDKNVEFIEKDTDEYNWLVNNSYKYGYILRYPKDKEFITGYMFEPWHFRYVGEKVATYLKENNLTFEEYYAKAVTK